MKTVSLENVLKPLSITDNKYVPEGALKNVSVEAVVVVGPLAGRLVLKSSQ